MTDFLHLSQVQRMCVRTKSLKPHSSLRISARRATSNPFQSRLFRHLNVTRNHRFPRFRTWWCETNYLAITFAIAKTHDRNRVIMCRQIDFRLKDVWRPRAGCCGMDVPGLWANGGDWSPRVRRIDIDVQNGLSANADDRNKLWNW